MSDHFSEHASFFYQLERWSILFDLTVIHDDDPVKLSDSHQSMCDRDHSGITELHLDALLDDLLRF